MKATQKEREQFLRDSLALLGLDIPSDQVEVNVCVPLRLKVLRGFLADFILRKERGELGKDTIFAILVPSSRGKALDTIESYAANYDPSLRWVMLDENGCGWESLTGGKCKQVEIPTLSEFLNGRAWSTTTTTTTAGPVPGNLFTPNNQWLFKVMLLFGIDDRYWGGPQLPRVFSISELADAAAVPQPSVSRFVGLAEDHGFILRSGRGLGMQRIPILLDQWTYHLRNSPDPSMPVRPLYEQLAVDDWAKLGGADLVAGGEGAIRAMQLSIRNQGRAVLYARSFDQVLEQHDLTECRREDSTCDLRVPAAARAVFDAAVNRNGQKLADLVQLYLDARLSMARGEEQAEHIFESVLAPCFRNKQWH